MRLLGAVTVNYTEGELIMIVEYCEYGSLKKFLVSGGYNFINYVNPENGDYDSQMIISMMTPGNNSQVTLTTKDLIYFAYQISSGMEYLMGRKVSGN